ncbi:DUF4249 family protein [bacterium]|nr:DUF4249 family protein [bacterium]
MHISNKTICALSAIFLLLTACTDPIDVKLDEGVSQLNVDAFINDKAEAQKVRLVMTTNYFDNNTILPVEDAVVTLLNDSTAQEWSFSYDKEGYYTLPQTDNMVLPFNSYTLKISHNGQHYSAHTMAMPTTPVDSITFELQVPNGPGTLDGYIGEFWGKDIPGMPNFYWIKTYVNDTFISDPNFLNVSYDAAQGQGSDGLTFIPPIRRGITTFPNIFQKGDKVRVEILGITYETYNFLLEAQSQITNGGLFATPPYNVVTNITNDSGTDKVADQAVGWFSVATISSLEAVAE